jgi:hypothetical protein
MGIRILPRYGILDDVFKPHDALMVIAIAA